MFTVTVTMLTLSAAPVTREVVAPSPADGVLLAHADAVKLRALDRQRHAAWKYTSENVKNVAPFKPLLPYQRYFWFPYDREKVEDRLIAFKLLFNKLSTQPEFHTPTLVASNVLRIDTRALGWGERQLGLLELFADNGIDCYFHAQKVWAEDDKEELITYWPGGKNKDGETYERGKYGIFPKKGSKRFVPSPLIPEKEINDLREWLFSEVPILNAEQFYLYTARQQSIRNKEEGVGYYEWFGKNGLKTREDYFDLVGLDEKKAQKQLKEWRAFLLSGTSEVSQKSRFIGALNGVNGRVWFTEDVFSEDAKNLFALRLRRGESQADANEYFAPLQNGLAVTFLSAASADKEKDGKAQAKAPPEVGSDDSAHRVGRDPAIHDDLSCMRCHAKFDMLMPFKNRDWVRNFFAEGKPRKLTDPDPDVELELRRQYLSDLHKLLKKDQDDYAEAVAECTRSARHPKGLTCTKAFDIYCSLWNELVELDPKTKLPPVSRAVLCRELGVSEKVFVDNLNKHVNFRGQGNLIAARFLDDDGAMSREELEATYGFFAGVMVSQAIPEKIKQQRKK